MGIQEKCWEKIADKEKVWKRRQEKLVHVL